MSDFRECVYGYCVCVRVYINVDVQACVYSHGFMYLPVAERICLCIQA